MPLFIQPMSVLGNRTLMLVGGVSASTPDASHEGLYLFIFELELELELYRLAAAP